MNRDAKLEKTMGYELEFLKNHLHAELSEARGFVSETGWTPDEVDCFVLMNDDNSLTSLFRYCAAMKSLRPEVAALYESEAVVEYLDAPKAYNKVWADLIPPSLRVAAARRSAGLYKS
jgi:hypothetical protein